MKIVRTGALLRIPRHGLKALAAGAVLVAAALPLTVASSAGAAGSISSLSFDTQAGVGGNGTQAGGPSFGSGGSGKITINGSGFAHDGSTVTITSNAPGVTFTGASESSTSTATVSFSSTSTSPGSYNLTLTDDTNPGGVVATGLLVVNPAPSIASLSISTASVNGATHYTEVITGADFVSTPSVVFTNTVNGTKLLTFSTTWNSSTQVTYVFEALNALTSAPATAGTYNLSVTNADGGTTTSASAMTISAAPITNLNPSAFPSANQTDVVTINGSGFEQGAVTTFPGCPEVSSVTSTVWSSASTLTVTFVQSAGSGTCSVTVTNPAPNAGNGAVATLTGGIGFNTAALVAPTITATSDTTAIVPGSPASTVTFSGNGFSQYDTGFVYTLADGSNEFGVSLSSPSGNNGTSESYTLNVATGPVATAGPVTVSISGSNPFPGGIIVAGPVITGQSPAVLPAGSPIGTTVTLTGSGFTSTLVEASFGGGTLAGTVHYVSPSTLAFVVTTPPVPSDNGSSYVTVEENNITGIPTSSAFSSKFFFKVGAPPTITSDSYVPGTTGVGVGATSQTMTINGTNFQAGAVVGNFKNAGSVADPNVGASVQSINPGGTVITISVSIGVGDANTLDSFTVTNPDGGIASSTTNTVWLIIQPGPTVSATSPASASANGTTAFTLTGSGFAAGASVTATADGTCGAATVVSATSITVSCTFGAATSSAALLVKNANGGTATSAVVLAGTSPPPPPPAPHITSEKGNAVIGRTVSISVVGTGFSGKPSVTTSGTLVKVVVLGASATHLVVRVIAAKTARTGRRTLTFTFAKTKVARVTYLIIK
jgi:hypothetical protein